MTDFRETKIEILSEEHSRAFQEAVFKAGGRWHEDGEFPCAHEQHYLYVNNDLVLEWGICASFFESHEYKEIEFPPSHQTEEQAAPAQKFTFDEDEALTLAERTFSTGIDEQLASDIIQYASRLHSRYQQQLTNHPCWNPKLKYLRKTKTKLINGVEVPDISFTPEDNEYYFYPDPTMPCMYEMEYFHNYAEECGHRLTNKMCYPTTDEGREAAILHSKAMLGIK